MPFRVNRAPGQCEITGERVVARGNKNCFFGRSLTNIGRGDFFFSLAWLMGGMVQGWNERKCRIRVCIDISDLAKRRKMKQKKNISTICSLEVRVAPVQNLPEDCIRHSLPSIGWLVKARA